LSELNAGAQREAFCDGLADDGWKPQLLDLEAALYMSSLAFYNFPLRVRLPALVGRLRAGRRVGRRVRASLSELLLATGCCATEEAVRGTLGYDLSTADF